MSPKPSSKSRAAISGRGNATHHGRPKTRGNFALASLRQTCGTVDPAVSLQKGFASWIGVSTRALVAYENGERPLPLRVRAMIAERTGVDPASLTNSKVPRSWLRRGATEQPYSASDFSAWRSRQPDPAMVEVAVAADVETMQAQAAALLRVAHRHGLFTGAFVAVMEGLTAVADDMELRRDWEAACGRPAGGP